MFMARLLFHFLLDWHLLGAAMATRPRRLPGLDFNWASCCRCCCGCRRLRPKGLPPPLEKGYLEVDKAVPATAAAAAEEAARGAIRNASVPPGASDTEIINGMELRR